MGESDKAMPQASRRAKAGGRTTEFDHDTAEQRFLAALARNGNVTLACRHARINHATAYRWREAEPNFKEAWTHALTAAADVLEKEAWRRAVKGTLRPVFHEGVQVGSVTVYSDKLLEFLLKAAAPEKYRERVTQEHTGGVLVRVVYDNDWRGRAGEGTGGA